MYQNLLLLNKDLIKIFKPQESRLIVTLHRWCHILGLKIARTEIEEVKNDPEFPGILSITRLLSRYYIENVVVKVGPKQLNDLPIPSMLYLTIDSGIFVVLERVEKSSVKLFEAELGFVSKTFEELSECWTGVAIISPKSVPQPYNPNYFQSKVRHIRARYVHFICTVVAAILLLGFVNTGVQPDINVILAALLKSVGLLISVILIRHQFENSFSINFCQIGGKFNCKAVLNSNFFKLSKSINLSEISLVYYLGSLLLILFTAFVQGNDVMLFFKIANLMIVPMVITSIYYQWRIIKTWCPLCLTLGFVIAIETFAYLRFDFPFTDFRFLKDDIYYIILSFFTAFLFWMIYKNIYIEYVRIPTTKRSLQYLLWKSNVWDALLDHQSRVKISPFQNELIYGKDSSKLQLLLVVSPLCSICTLTIKRIIKVIQNDPSTCLIVRFCIPTDSTNLYMLKSAEYIVQRSIEDSANVAFDLLSKWALTPPSFQDIDQLIQTTKPDNKAGEIVRLHMNWCQENQIFEVPKLFINGVMYPDKLSLDQDFYHFYMSKQVYA